MTEATIRQALRSSVDEVLEKMFFAETMGECSAWEPADAPPDGHVAAELTFAGDPSGALLLRLTSPAARQIAADFLGLDEGDLSDRQISEVALELANMICGSLLSRVKSNATFQLDTPRIMRSADAIAGSLSNIRYAVQLSNGCLGVSVRTGISLCPQPAQSAF